jgi:CRP-like cAMP-binding protein
MKELINILLQFGQLKEQDIAFIQSKIVERTLKKGDYFSEAGKIAKEVAFIKEGILRVCYYNNKGEEITRYFMGECDFAVDLNSFTSKIPSSEYVQAVTNCQLIVFSTDALKDMSLNIKGFDSLIGQITTKALLEKVKRISPMLAEDATSRYTHFLENHSELAARLPLSLLASYLGITQSSLSRIRRIK